GSSPSASHSSCRSRRAGTRSRARWTISSGVRSGSGGGIGRSVKGSQLEAHDVVAVEVLTDRADLLTVDLEPERIPVLVVPSVEEASAADRLDRDPASLHDEVRHLDLRLARLEEAADRTEELLDDRAPLVSACPRDRGRADLP